MKSKTKTYYVEAITFKTDVTPIRQSGMPIKVDAKVKMNFERRAGVLKSGVTCKLFDGRTVKADIAGHPCDMPECFCAWQLINAEEVK